MQIILSPILHSQIAGASAPQTDGTREKEGGVA